MRNCNVMLLFVGISVLSTVPLSSSTIPIPKTTEECLKQKWNPSSVEEAKEYIELIAENNVNAIVVGNNSDMSTSHIPNSLQQFFEEDRILQMIADDAVRFEEKVEQFKKSSNASTIFAISCMLTAKDIAHLQSNDTYVPHAGNCSDIPDVDKYRTLNGICNNKRHLNWGACFQPLLRWHPPAYGGEGYNTPVTTYSGMALPDPREVSRYLHRSNATLADTQQSALSMVWGQFLSHDLQEIPKSPDKYSICSKYCNTIAKHCFNIKTPDDDDDDYIHIYDTDEYADNDYDEYGSAQTAAPPAAPPPASPPAALPIPKPQQDCIPFVRSAPTHQYSLDRLFPREQFSKVTSYMDASNVYGLGEYQTKQLRTMNDGKLMTAIGNNLPFDCGVSKRCVGSLPLCFLAGTGAERVSMHVMMVVMNTLWVREHNRIVSELKKLNPTWNDEKLYQEGRKIVGALIQKITYSEYAPQLLGKYVFGRIMPNYCGYEENVKAGIYNEFATAVFRFGHSQVVSKIARVDDQYNTLSDITLQQAFFQPERYYERDGLLDNYMRGLLARQSLKTDRFLSDQVTDHLFQPVNSTRPGLDLAAINIQRGRDHGLARYYDYQIVAHFQLQYMGVPLPNPYFTSHNHQLIKKVYGSIYRCDLWPCGLLERPLETAFPAFDRTGSQLGPTFSFIIAQQLARLRDGDRFFYKSPGVFSAQQLAAIEEVTMSAVICANSNISTIQARAFSQQIGDNKAISCTEVEKKQGLDLTPWRECPNKDACKQSCCGCKQVAMGPRVRENSCCGGACSSCLTCGATKVCT